MSPDRVIFSFVLGWVVLLAVLIALDWLGNPNRGAFRPKGDRPPSDRATRRTERVRRRLEDDASVRAALRDAYGASSLRFTWTSEHETRARQLDDALVVDELHGAVDVTSREVASIDRTTAIGDPLPNVDETDAADEDDARPARGWSIGGDPLSLTARGTTPAPGTIRSRVWKNHGLGGAWSEQNRSLLAAGKAPRRVNPINGRHERAAVDVDTGRASWGSEPVDPFDAPT
jgi:hypothetical protein